MSKPNNRQRPAARPAPTRLTAATADRFVLYEASVQAPDVEIAFIDRVFHRLKGRTPTRLREDFCGTGLLACEWVKERPANRAMGLDLHARTLAWGKATHVAKLAPEQQARLSLVRQNVLAPPRGKHDVIAALNFSYWIFRQRAILLRYFERCRETLVADGLLVLDLMGGADCHMPVTDRTRISSPQGRFTYLWEHATVHPISGHTTCKIHFEFDDGSKIRNAFTYHWRLWSIAELRDILHDAGLTDIHVFWEGTTPSGRGDGVYRESRTGTPDRSYVAYIVAGRRRP